METTSLIVVTTMFERGPAHPSKHGQQIHCFFDNCLPHGNHDYSSLPLAAQSLVAVYFNCVVHLLPLPLCHKRVFRMSSYLLDRKHKIRLREPHADERMHLINFPYQCVQHNELHSALEMQSALCMVVLTA